MKHNALKIVLCTFLILTLTACSNRYLKTKEISPALTQTSVILESEIDDKEEYSAFLKTYSPSFTIPGLYEGFIPQGIAVDGANVYISGYFEDDTFPSMLAVVDLSTEKLIKSITLGTVQHEPYFAHAGGLAVSDNLIYITSDSEALVFEKKDIEKSVSGETVYASYNFKLNTKGSFANISNNTLWVGDFIEDSDSEKSDVSLITTLPSGESFYAYCEGYNLVDGYPSDKRINEENNGYIPDYFLAIPTEVQGMTIAPSGSFIFSRSYGRNNDATISVFKDILLSEKVGTVTIGGQNIDILACSLEQLKKEYVAPPMTEGIAATDDGTVYLLFESAAAKYRASGKLPLDTVYTADYN